MLLKKLFIVITLQILSRSHSDEFNNIYKKINILSPNKLAETKYPQNCLINILSKETNLEYFIALCFEFKFFNSSESKEVDENTLNFELIKLYQIFGKRKLKKFRKIDRIEKEKKDFEDWFNERRYQFLILDIEDHSIKKGDATSVIFKEKAKASNKTHTDCFISEDFDIKIGFGSIIFKFEICNSDSSDSAEFDYSMKLKENFHSKSEEKKINEWLNDEGAIEFLMKNLKIFDNLDNSNLNTELFRFPTKDERDSIKNKFLKDFVLKDGFLSNENLILNEEDSNTEVISFFSEEKEFLNVKNGKKESTNNSQNHTDKEDKGNGSMGGYGENSLIEYKLLASIIVFFMFGIVSVS